MSRAVLSLYLAAGLSFAAGMLRDWLLISRIPAHADVFAMMYAAAIGSSFSVNALTLGHGLRGRTGSLGWLLALGALVYLLIAVVWQPLESKLLWLGLPVPLFYIWGAQHARRLVDTGHVLLGRLRDGLASLLMVGLILMSLGEASFPLAVALATSAFALVASTVLRGYPDVVALPSLPWSSWRRQASILIYANMAPAMVNLWALRANELDGLLWGISAPVAVRVSMYAFQILTLPSILLSRWPLVSLPAKLIGAMPWACASATAVAMALPPALALPMVPLAGLATLYASVLLMHQQSLIATNHA